MKRFQIVLKILASVFATLLTSCAYTPKAQFVETNSAEGTFVDTRDGQTYMKLNVKNMGVSIHGLVLLMISCAQVAGIYLFLKNGKY